MWCRCLLVIFLLAFSVIMFYLVYEPYQEDTLEITRRLVSKMKQEKVYARLTEYVHENNKVPDDLEELVDGNLLEDEDIYTVPTGKKQKVKFYYFPSSYKDPNAVLLSDVRDTSQLKKTKLKTIAIEMFGNGEIKERIINDPTNVMNK